MTQIIRLHIEDNGVYLKVEKKSPPSTGAILTIGRDDCEDRIIILDRGSVMELVEYLKGCI